MRRRFGRSLRNWSLYWHQADRWQLHYNGGPGTVMVARGRGDAVITFDPSRLRLFEELVRSF